MAFKTLQQTASQADVQDADILCVARSTGPMSHVTALAFTTYLQTSLGSTFLKVANNLSDLASVTTARTNLGLGSAATHAATDFILSGSPTFSAPTITGGMTFSGNVAGNVQAVAATTLDVSAAEIQTKSISVNTTFTLTGQTSGKWSGMLLKLTTSSSAQPTFTGALWSGGTAPTLPNGTHLFGLLYDGTSWDALLLATSLA